MTARLFKMAVQQAAACDNPEHTFFRMLRI